MNILKEVGNLWLKNFDKGLTVYQMCLMALMFVAVFQNNTFLLMFCMVHCLIGYFEPTQERWGFK